MTIRFALCICVLLHLSLVNGVLGQTSIIEIGQTSIQSNNPVIYNRTIEFPAATSSTYQSVLRFFTRSDRPIVNVNRTFPPNSFNGSNCFITGIKVFDADRFNRGGLAQIIGGGLRQSNVTINFTSKPGEYMLFTVIIYGYCVQNISEQEISHATNTTNTTDTLHAIPINNDQPIGPSYGWNIEASNVSALNTSSVLVQNITTSSNGTPWWNFWS